MPSEKDSSPHHDDDPVSETTTFKTSTASSHHTSTSTAPQEQLQLQHHRPSSIHSNKSVTNSFLNMARTMSQEVAAIPETVSGIAPPDGGYGWVVVFACFLNNFAMLGTMFSWGLFQQLYTDEVFKDQGENGASAISWIGTLAFGCMYVLGGGFSLFAAKIGYRRMISAGSVLVTGGLVAASFATQIWQLYLTQGILFGIGAAMANPCILAAPAQWFVKRRGMASGIGISGSGVGGLVFSLIIEKMNATIGYRWCLRALAIIVFCSMTTSSLLIRQFNTTGVKASNVTMKDVETMRQPRFLILILGVLCTSFGYFSPLNMLPMYAVDLGFSRSQGAMLISILNGASFIGRVAAALGDKIGLIHFCIFCAAASSLTTLCVWMFATTLPVLVVYVVLYGIMGGGFISILGPILAEQFGTGSLTILVGVTFGVNGLGSLLGTPIATAILASVGNSVNYRPSIGFIGGIMMVGCMIFVALRVYVGRLAAATAAGVAASA